MDTGATVTQTKSLGIELTTKCNFKCSHCYQTRGNSFFDFKNIHFISNIANANNIIHIYMTGGEPLLHKNFNDFYLYFRKKGFLVSVLTNGSILPKNTHRIFKEFPPHTIEVSLYGFSNKSYAQTTRMFKFTEVMQTISYLQSLGVCIIAKYILLKSTYNDIESFYLHTKKNKICTTYNAQVIPRLDGNPAPLNSRLEPEVLRSLCARHGLTLLQKEKEPCTAGTNLYIRHNGKISGCPVLETEIDVTIFDPPSVIHKFVQNMATTFGEKTCDYGRCPAWQQLENATSRTAFLNAVMGD